MSKNRFAGLQAVKQLQVERSVKPSKIVNNQVTDAESMNNDVIPKPNVEPKIQETLNKRGRPNGKRSNADFQQVTAYIRRDTYKKVTIKLIDQHERGEFSELIEELLQLWLIK